MTANEKSIEILNQELDSLTTLELHELFMFYYKINHQHFNLVTYDKFYKFLQSFDKNPFRCNDDKNFKKQLTESLIAYTDDYISLITAVMLLKKKFTIDEIIDNYYSNINVFDNNLF